MPYFAGLDWGGAVHAVCVIDETGRVVAREEVRHDAEGLRRLVALLERIDPGERIPVAIERPSGLVVDTLVEAGHPVVPIHPNALKASRPRYRAAGGKSDPEDAYIAADMLRTDGHRLRALRPLSDEIRALRAQVRTRDDLVAQRVATVNRLRELLESFWPGAGAIFADIDSAISLAFLERYPDPTSARRLGEKRLASFLARHGYSGRRSAAELLERLRAAPEGQAGAREQRAKGEAVQDLVVVLQALRARIDRITRSIEQAVAELPAGRIVMSFPRAGRVNAAQILAELGDDPARYASAEQLASEAGVAPVTHRSGKRRAAVVFRSACNKRLRWALTTWADHSRHASPWAKDIYDRARARGCHHAHAVRILARAWTRVLWRCWRDGVPYHVDLHRGATAALNAPQPVATAGGG